MKTLKHLINTTLAFSLFFAACSHKSDVKPVKTDTLPKYVQTANVYVAGSTYDSVTYVRQAAYWKNGVATILTNGTKNAAANAITVNGNDVYTAGYTTDANGAYIATYWKNGVQVNLTTNAVNASAGSIAVDGNDVYITGFIESSAVYWKNGQRVTLSLLSDKNSGSTAGIAIQGSDIYISGYQLGAGGASTVYWKNSVPTKLPNDVGSYAGKNIAFQDGHMYIPATYNLVSAKPIPNYWIDDTPVSVADGTTAINTIEIAVSGADVYLACLTAKGAGYFKNKKLTLLPGDYTEVTGIKVQDNDVYTSGQSTHDKKSVATFWKNGVPVYLSSSIGKGGFASSIVVTPLK
ncbi:hypothetical protein AAFN85_28355 [Mucilaginibacter sp. CAU 1740]|uniref:hypothetical protein n=1 Tax=Mucilaginibacter sp. CAU 1740 TaxID=3140365 RepID=UPI00325BA482